MVGKTLLVLGAALISSVAFAGQFCVGERVVDLSSGGHFDATIAEIYSDGTAYLNYDGNYSSRTVALSELGERLTSLDGYSVGQRVVDLSSGGHFDATIAEIYSDNTVYLNYDGNYDSRVVSLSELGQRLSSLDGFFTGEHVVDLSGGGHFDATIAEIYSDGTAYLNYDGNYDSRVVSLSSLGQIERCTDGCN